MNRHDRRPNAARARQNNFVNEYVHHLPEVGPEALGKPGSLIHACYYHEAWCAIYDDVSRGLGSCNCNPDVRYFKEPKRS
jgi:hypothetical protein